MRERARTAGDAGLAIKAGTPSSGECRCDTCSHLTRLGPPGPHGLRRAALPALPAWPGPAMLSVPQLSVLHTVRTAADATSCRRVSCRHGRDRKVHTAVSALELRGPSTSY